MKDILNKRKDYSGERRLALKLTYNRIQKDKNAVIKGQNESSFQHSKEIMHTKSYQNKTMQPVLIGVKKPL